MKIVNSYFSITMIFPLYCFSLLTNWKICILKSFPYICLFLRYFAFVRMSVSCSFFISSISPSLDFIHFCILCKIVWSFLSALNLNTSLPRFMQRKFAFFSHSRTNRVVKKWISSLLLAIFLAYKLLRFTSFFFLLDSLSFASFIRTHSQVAIKKKEEIFFVCVRMIEKMCKAGEQKNFYDNKNFLSGAHTNFFVTFNILVDRYICAYVWWGG